MKGRTGYLIAAAAALLLTASPTAAWQVSYDANVMPDAPELGADA